MVAWNEVGGTERSGRSRAMKEGNEQDVAAGMVWNRGQEAEVTQTLNWEYEKC